MDSEEVSNASKSFEDILNDGFRISNENCSSIASDRSLKAFFQERLQKTSLEANTQNTILKLAESWGAFIGDPFEKQSLKWFWLEECLDGDNLFLVNSYQAIINNIAKAVKTHAKIHFETAVQRIMSQQHRQQNKRISVTTTNGNFDFDEVVVTVPLGCLKAGSIRFSPALSSNIIRGIADASYGHLEKALVVFPTAFWEDSHPGTVDGSPDVPVTGPSFPVFANFLHPTYAPSEQQSWNIQMLAFSSPTIFGIDAKPVLQFYLWGASATHMASAVANLGPTTPEYYETIVRLLRPFYSRLPNYEQASSKCTPIEVFATKWQYDDLAGRGSYTNFRIPEDGRCPEDDPVVDKGVRAMRQGMPDAGIWFAGEHTAPFVALGTTTGAYWSGESVAMRIIKAYGRPEDQKELN